MDDAERASEKESERERGIKLEAGVQMMSLFGLKNGPVIMKPRYEVLRIRPDTKCSGRVC